MFPFHHRFAALSTIRAATSLTTCIRQPRRLVAVGLLAGIALAAGCGDDQGAGNTNSPATGGGPAGESDNAAPQALVALERLALRHDLAMSELDLARATTTQYPVLDRAIGEYKAVNRRTGTIMGIALDELGQEVDPETLRRDEESARIATERRADPLLAARLSQAGKDELIDVAIWLKEPPVALPPRPALGSVLSSRAIDERLADMRSQRAAHVRVTVAPVRESLTQRGFWLTEDSHAPLLYGTLPAHVIEEMRGWEKVDRMYLPQPVEPTLRSELLAIFADVVHSRGITGAGVPVAEIEVGGQINTANPLLAGVTQDTLYSCLSAHADAVAGIIRSTDSSQTGVAPGSNLWIGGSCGGWPSELYNRSTAAANWGACAFNLSFGAHNYGVLSDIDRYYDSLVINQWRSVIVAAGNMTYGPYVESPGTAYNVVTVGSYNEMTGLISAYSAGVDPVSAHNDREKPEVAAPGEDFISTVNSSPWLGGVGSGTSYSAPMVTGTAALMMQRNPSLQYWPESVRAILMASATDNIEGDSTLSEFDGAGGIYADYADDVVTGVRGTWGGISYDCNAPYATTVGMMSLAASVTTRVVISWDTDPNYSSYGSQPSADLDLIIKDPWGNVVASSASWDNTYEIVQFVPASTGTYSIEVNKYRCDLSPRYLGFAWFR